MPRPDSKPGTLQAFADEAVLKATDNCILWPFGNPALYPVLTVSKQVQQVSHYVLEKSGIPRPSLLHEAAHLPTVCHNKRCINHRHLRWATRKENMQDKIIDGTNYHGGRAKLTDDQVRAIRADGRMLREIAEDYKVHETTIWSIKHRKTYSRVSD